MDLWGDQTQTLYVEFSRARLSQLGISPDMIFATPGVPEPGEPRRQGQARARVS